MNLWKWTKFLIKLLDFKNSRPSLVKDMDHPKIHIDLQFSQKTWCRLTYTMLNQNRPILWEKLNSLIWKNKNLLIFIWGKWIKILKIKINFLKMMTMIIQFFLVQRITQHLLTGVNIQVFLLKLKAKVCAVLAGHSLLYLKLKHILPLRREYST
jgi:hypothetical protein